jgi:ArsR family transcriptional regulator, arsenate/arsenite/antimonite-responsive transcriptional repressor
MRCAKRTTHPTIDIPSAAIVPVTTNLDLNPSTLLVAGFQALSDPLRLQVLDLLRDRECCVCDLCEILNVNQSKLSFHLKSLKDAHLVQTRQSGRWIYYRLNLPQFIALEAYLRDFQQIGPIGPTRECGEPD